MGMTEELMEVQEVTISKVGSLRIGYFKLIQSLKWVLGSLKWREFLPAHP